ncbi:hypothetical protein Mapa_014859 [Marchantia paleacea]|nr:hypothetical protein Mapa_014859 [Marchantia paleacea]
MIKKSSWPPPLQLQSKEELSAESCGLGQQIWRRLSSAVAKSIESLQPSNHHR